MKHTLRPEDALAVVDILQRRVIGNKLSNYPTEAVERAADNVLARMDPAAERMDCSAEVMADRAVCNASKTIRARFLAGVPVRSRKPAERNVEHDAASIQSNMRSGEGEELEAQAVTEDEQSWGPELESWEPAEQRADPRAELDLRQIEWRLDCEALLRFATPMQRAILNCRLTGMDDAAISAQHGIPVGTVASHASRAVAQIRKQIA